MAAFNLEQIEAVLKDSRAKAKGAAAKPRSVYPCNFRSAGRLSNENARLLTGVHETFARHLGSTLDVYLGTALEVKLQVVDQLPSKEHIAGIPPLDYIAPFYLGTIPSTMIVEFDINLVFPIIDLLMGGSGAGAQEDRELSEIEEEIMHEVMLLIARQAESAWHIPNASLVPNRRTKASVLHQYCPPNEKVTFVRFEVDIAGQVGSFQLVFPANFLNALIKQIKLDQPQKSGRLQSFTMPDIRERILDCDVTVAAELPTLKVAVRDLVSLQPGSVLKLRAPVQNPGLLRVEGQDIFEAMPVRTGSQKAAQLGRRIPVRNWGKE
jgi:flagellar motor switch protein FliM